MNVGTHVYRDMTKLQRGRMKARTAANNLVVAARILGSDWTASSAATSARRTLGVTFSSVTDEGVRIETGTCPGRPQVNTIPAAGRSLWYDQQRHGRRHQQQAQPSEERPATTCSLLWSFSKAAGSSQSPRQVSNDPRLGLTARFRAGNIAPGSMEEQRANGNRVAKRNFPLPLSSFSSTLSHLLCGVNPTHRESPRAAPRAAAAGTSTATAASLPGIRSLSSIAPYSSFAPSQPAPTTTTLGSSSSISRSISRSRSLGGPHPSLNGVSRGAAHSSSSTRPCSGQSPLGPILNQIGCKSCARSFSTRGGGGGGLPPTFSQYLRAFAVVAVGICAVGLLFTVGFFALVAVIAVAAVYMLVRTARQSSLGRYVSNTKLGKEMSIRAGTAKASRMAQRAEQGLPASNFLGMIMPMIAPMISRVLESQEMFERQVSDLADEVAELVEKNGTASKRIGDLREMTAASFEVVQDEMSSGGMHGKNIDFSIVFIVGGAKSQGEVHVRAKSTEAGSEDGKVQIHSAVLKGTREGEKDVKLVKGPPIIMDINKR